MKNYIVIYSLNYKLYKTNLITEKNSSRAYIKALLMLPREALITSVVEVIG